MTDYPIRKTNHCYDLDKCLIEWELIQTRLGDKLWESDKDRGTGIYGQTDRLVYNGARKMRQTLAVTMV